MEPSYNPAFHKLQKIVYLTQYVSLDILEQNEGKEILMMFFDLRSNWKRVSLPFLSPSSLSSRRSRTQRILIITLMILMMTKPANQIQKIRSQTRHSEQPAQLVGSLRGPNKLSICRNLPHHQLCT